MTFQLASLTVAVAVAVVAAVAVAVAVALEIPLVASPLDEQLAVCVEPGRIEHFCCYYQAGSPFEESVETLNL